MNCREFRSFIDSFLSDELLVETNHELLDHLEDCRDCREQLAARRALRGRLRTAVRTSPAMGIDQSFAVGLRMKLRESALRPSFLGIFASYRLPLAAALAGLVVIAAVGYFFLDRRGSDEPVTARSGQVTQDSVVRSNNGEVVNAVRAAWTDLAELAVGDHENCAVKFNLAEPPISLSEAADKYGSYNRDLDRAVTSALEKRFPGSGPDKVEFLEAHFCLYKGRRFSHIVFRQKGELISVLVADTDLPFDTNALNEDVTVGPMHASGSRVGTHAVFVVSAMTDAENDVIATTIKPAIRQHIESAGA